MFVGKEYISDDLLKMNIMIIPIKDDDDDGDVYHRHRHNNNNNNNNNIFFFYFLESCDMQHKKLEYVNYNYIQRLINLELLSSMVFQGKKT